MHGGQNRPYRTFTQVLHALTRGVAHLRAEARLDEVLIRAVQTELTFRQAGISTAPRPHRFLNPGLPACTGAAGAAG